MSLLLAIETSSSEYRIALGRDERMIFDSAQQRGQASSRDIAGLVGTGLRSLGAEARDISGITINIGPGGLSYVRSGVAFANALSFSLGIAIHAFNSFEIVGQEARAHTTLPVLCAIAAANDNAYVGLVNGAFVEGMRFGVLGTVVAKVSGGLAEVAVAGRIRDRVSSLLPRVKVVDTGIEIPDARVLLEMGYRARERGLAPAGQVSPLNEQAAVFHEQT